MHKSPLTLKNQRGVVLITILIVGILLTFIGLSMADLVISQYRQTSDNVYRANATLTAEAGIEFTLKELNADNDFTGYSTPTEFFNDQVRGRGVYTTEVTAGAGNERIVTSTAQVYRYGSTTDPVSERSIKVSMVGTSSITPSVYAGAGGLILSGSASINNSDVYVNGTVTMSGQASIGSDTNPVNLYVANYACPSGTSPGPTYPQVCATTQPIDIANNSGAQIVGTICATNQTQTKFPDSPTNTKPPQIRPGTSGGAGLVPGCVAPAVTLPYYDKAAHVSQVTTTANSTDSTYDCTQWVNPIGQTRTWPANLQLNGNVDIASSCDLTLTGNVYITGNLNIGGAANIRVADSLGTTQPVIVVNGTITGGGSGEVIANSSGTNARFISFLSYNNCDPSCTGTDLKRSQDIRSITVNGGGSYAGAMFQAYWTEVKITGSGLVGSVTGQVVNMQGAGNITFGTSLSTGTFTWTIRSYQRNFD